MSPGAGRRHVALRALLTAGWLLLASGGLGAEVEVERVELNVRLDPALRSLYAQAKLVLRNRSAASRDTLELEFPALLEPRVQVRAVWDRGGELPWRQEPPEQSLPRPLLIGLRSLLTPGKKLTLVVSYDLNLEGFVDPNAALQVSPETASLPTTGWYPVPADSQPAVPRTIRLTVRLPKEWQVSVPVKVKQIRDGTALAIYELEPDRVEPGQVLLRAGTTLPR